jgi:hypothetical protein
MADDWLTYEQAAERLSVSPEAIRQKAIRGRWQRTKGNDGKARVRLPDGQVDAVRTPSGHPNKRLVRTPSERASDVQLIKALETLVETWKERASTAEARLAEADARNERLVGDSTAKDARHATEIAAEREKFERAHAELVALTGRLAAIVEQDRLAIAPPIAAPAPAPEMGSAAEPNSVPEPRRSLLRYWFGWRAAS